MWGRAATPLEVEVTANRPFEVVCEIEPPTRPDLMHVRHQRDAQQGGRYLLVSGTEAAG
jgi:hypothetical protein